MIFVDILIYWYNNDIFFSLQVNGVFVIKNCSLSDLDYIELAEYYFQSWCIIITVSLDKIIVYIQILLPTLMI